jgi:hypothetical protein
LRAGPLSTPKIIDLLNHYFVPVTSSNEEADDGGTGPPAEKAERKRIYLDFYGKKLPLGDVNVYIVGPDRTSIGGLDINSANDPEKMAAFLMRIITQLHTAPGPPAVKPHPQSVAPASAADAMVLHLVSRSMAGGSWHEFPAENWIVLSRAEWTQLLPGEALPLNLKTSWEIPRPVAVKLAEWVYPQNEEKTQVNRSRVDVASFRLTLVTLENAMSRARIDGKVRLKHTFYPGGGGPDDFADSELVGFVDFDTAKRTVQRLRLVTNKAIYAGTEFRASLVSMSRETLDALGK